MSPTSRASRLDVSPHVRGTGSPLPDSRGVRRGIGSVTVPRPYGASVADDRDPLERSVVRSPRESRNPLRVTPGSEDAGGASPEAQWQGPAGTVEVRWQDLGPDRATRPGGGP
jgi:hypothetical protein